MARPWKELKNAMPAAARARVDARVRRTLAGIHKAGPAAGAPAGRLKDPPPRRLM